MVADCALASAWQRVQATRAKSDEDEKTILRRALEESGGVIAQAARSVGIARTTFLSRVEVLRIRQKTEE